MIQTSIDRLAFLIREIPVLLGQIRENDFTFRSAPGKWSKKETLGHLIDSAANNHQRFIRGQYEENPTIGYDQDQWNELNHYNEINTAQLIAFWISYNQHLLEIMNRISRENLTKECRLPDGTSRTIAFLMTDYVTHMEHHLKQITDY